MYIFAKDSLSDEDGVWSLPEFFAGVAAGMASSVTGTAAGVAATSASADGAADASADTAAFEPSYTARRASFAPMDDGWEASAVALGLTVSATPCVPGKFSMPAAVASGVTDAASSPRASSSAKTAP